MPLFAPFSLLLGLHGGPVDRLGPTPQDWSRLRLEVQSAPLRIPLWEGGFKLKPDQMVTRYGLTMLHGLAGGTKVNALEVVPAALLPPGL